METRLNNRSTYLKIIGITCFRVRGIPKIYLNADYIDYYSLVSSLFHMDTSLYYYQRIQPVINHFLLRAQPVSYTPLTLPTKA